MFELHNINLFIDTHTVTDNCPFLSSIYVFFLPCGTATQRRPWLPHSWGSQITHNDAPQSVGLLWTSDQLVAETSTWQHTTLTTGIHAPGGIRTHNLSRRAAADLRLRPRGHWDRLLLFIRNAFQCKFRFLEQLTLLFRLLLVDWVCK